MCFENTGTTVKFTKQEFYTCVFTTGASERLNLLTKLNIKTTSGSGRYIPASEFKHIQFHYLKYIIRYKTKPKQNYSNQTSSCRQIFTGPQNIPKKTIHFIFKKAICGLIYESQYKHNTYIYISKEIYIYCHTVHINSLRYVSPRHDNWQCHRYELKTRSQLCGNSINVLIQVFTCSKAHFTMSFFSPSVYLFTHCTARFHSFKTRPRSG